MSNVMTGFLIKITHGMLTMIFKVRVQKIIDYKIKLDQLLLCLYLSLKHLLFYGEAVNRKQIYSFEKKMKKDISMYESSVATF